MVTAGERTLNTEHRTSNVGLLSPSFVKRLRACLKIAKAWRARGRKWPPLPSPLLPRGGGGRKPPFARQIVNSTAVSLRTPHTPHGVGVPPASRRRIPRRQDEQGHRAGWLAPLGAGPAS